MTDIVTLTPNPTIDLATSVDRLEPFRKLRCADAQRDPGGGGINVARVLRRWDCEVLAIYPAGGPAGDLLKRLMRNKGIPSKAIAVAEDTREDFTVFESATVNQFRFVLPGATLSEEEWSACCDAIGAVDPPPRFVVASGSLAPTMPANSYLRAIYAAKAIGAKAVIDTSGAALKHALGKGVYLVKPNLRELTEITGLPIEDLSAQVAACQNLVNSDQASIVALTLAERGAIAVTRAGAWHARAPAIRPISTVGAGDSFLGTMLWRLGAGFDVPDALRYGVAAGSAALLAPGTELAHPEGTQHFLPQVTIEKIGS